LLRKPVIFSVESGKQGTTRSGAILLPFGISVNCEFFFTLLLSYAVSVGCGQLTPVPAFLGKPSPTWTRPRSALAHCAGPFLICLWTARGFAGMSPTSPIRRLMLRGLKAWRVLFFRFGPILQSPTWPDSSAGLRRNRDVRRCDKPATAGERFRELERVLRAPRGRRGRGRRLP